MLEYSQNISTSLGPTAGPPGSATDFSGYSTKARLICWLNLWNSFCMDHNDCLVPYCLYIVKNIKSKCFYDIK